MTWSDNLGAAGDEIYAALLKAHEGLSETQSHKLNACLVLLLANKVSNPAHLKSIFEEARRAVEG